MDSESVVSPSRSRATRTRSALFAKASKHLGDDKSLKSKIYKNVKIVFQLIFFICVACCGAYINHIYFDYDDNTQNWTAFFSCFGVIFAIIIGFLLENVLTRFDKLSKSIENELGEIQRARDVVYYLLPNINVKHNCNDYNNDNQNHLDYKQLFLQSLCDYTIQLRYVEWIQMSNITQSFKFVKLDPDTSKHLIKVYQTLQQLIMMFDSQFNCNCNSSCNQQHNVNNCKLASTRNITINNNILTIVIDSVNKISKYRQNRITMANIHISFRLKILALIMSCFCLSGFILMRVNNIYIKLFMSMAITTNFFLLYNIITDLDYPFFGMWNIDNKNVEMTIDKFIQKYNCYHTKPIIPHHTCNKTIDNRYLSTYGNLQNYHDQPQLKISVHDHHSSSAFPLRSQPSQSSQPPHESLLQTSHLLHQQLLRTN